MVLLDFASSTNLQIRIAFSCEPRAGRQGPERSVRSATHGQLSIVCPNSHSGESPSTRRRDRDVRGKGALWCTCNRCDTRSQGFAVLSLIRLSPPHHAIRRDKRGLVRHPATKAVAAPLVTATAVVAMDSVGTTSTLPAHALGSTPSVPTAAQATRSSFAVPQSTVPLPTTTAIAVPPSTTNTTSTITHL